MLESLFRHHPFLAVAMLLPLLASLVLTGCGSSSEAESIVRSSQSPLRIWYSTDDPVERRWVQDLANGYERTHRGTKVNLVAYSFEDLNTKLQLALSSGRPPDLAYVTPRGPGIPAYVGAHKLLDLNAYATRYHWAQRLQPGLLQAYNQPFGYYSAPRGHVMAVPMALAAVGILYNQQILQKLHLGVPRSLAEFDRALVKAKAASYVPLGLGNEDGWLGDDWYQTLVNALVSPSSLQPEQVLDKRFSFKGQSFLQAASILRTWSRQGYFTHNFGGLDAQEGIDQFFRGKTLFQMVSSSENSQIRADAAETHLSVGVFAFPRRQGGSRVMPYSGYLGWIVPRAGSNRSEAISFINYVLSPSTTNFLLKQSMLPAARAVSAPSGTPAWQRQYLQALNSAQRGVYLDAAPIANLNATMEANVQLLLQGYEPPQFLVKSLQQVYSTKHGGSTARIDGEF